MSPALAADLPVRSKEQLIAHIASGESLRADWRVGTEYEKLAVRWRTGERLPYEAESGPDIVGLLRSLAGCCGWSPVEERGRIVALTGEGASVTLEPGGQFELSGAPMADLHLMVAELQRHEVALEHLGEEFPISWMWAGADPINALADIPWMPKKRYEIMREYLPTRGGLAHAMMKATCTVQANLDFADEVDMGRKLRASMGVSSIVTAMFANSPLREGRPSGFKSWRSHIWTDTDPDRSGLLPWVFEGELPTYEQYVDYALGVPLFFLVREGRYLKCAGTPFQRFFDDGVEGHRPTRADWELHLSTLFPDVRLKTYLETRSADCVKPGLLQALPALWKGLLYDDSSLDAAWDLVKRWTLAEREAHRAEVARLALQTPAPGARYTTTELARELVEIARHGLVSQAVAAPGDAGPGDESGLLAPLQHVAATGRSPADVTLAWLAEGRRSRQDIIAHYGGAWTV